MFCENALLIQEPTKTISIIIFHPSTKHSQQHGANCWRRWGEGVGNSYYINYIFAFRRTFRYGMGKRLGRVIEADNFLVSSYFGLVGEGFSMLLHAWYKLNWSSSDGQNFQMNFLKTLIEIEKKKILFALELVDPHELKIKNFLSFCFHQSLDPRKPAKRGLRRH